MGFIAPGALSRSNGYQIKSKGPVDGRMTVDTLDDLTSDIWTEDYPVYEAMVVGVAQEDSLYMLKSGWNGEKYVLDPTNPDNWIKIGMDEESLKGAADIAYGNATAYTNTEIGKLSGVYEAKGAAADALADAKTYTNTEIGKLSEADTKNTAGSSNSTSKLYLVGAGSQSSTGVQTYSNSNVYMSGGTLYSSSASTTNLTATTATILHSLRLQPSDENYGGIINFGDIEEDTGKGYCYIGELEEDNLTIYSSSIITIEGVESVKINNSDTSTWKNTVQTNYDSGSTVYLAGTTATTSASTSNTP